MSGDATEKDANPTLCNSLGRGGGAFQPTVCKRPIQGEARDGMTALSLPRGILSAYNNTESRLALRSLTAQTHILASFQ
jgi:hypothetical protein